MSKKSDAVKRWRSETKNHMVLAFGGRCGICGYNKCMAALEFHHINPSNKSFSFGSIMSKPKARTRIADELEKCVCVCSNCHKEIHAGVSQRDLGTLPTFNRQLFESMHMPDRSTNKCPICGKLIPAQNKYCSLVCAGKARTKIQWDDKLLIECINKGMSFVSIGELFGVSDGAVRKHIKKLKQESV